MEKLEVITILVKLILILILPIISGYLISFVVKLEKLFCMLIASLTLAGYLYLMIAGIII